MESLLKTFYTCIFLELFMYLIIQNFIWKLKNVNLNKNIINNLTFKFCSTNFLETFNMLQVLFTNKYYGVTKKLLPKYILKQNNGTKFVKFTCS